MIKKEAEKIQKYKNLKIAVWCLWNLKAEMILIPEQQPGKTRHQEIQKTAIVNTAHTVREELM